MARRVPRARRARAPIEVRATGFDLLAATIRGHAEIAKACLRALEKSGKTVLAAARQVRVETVEPPATRSKRRSPKK